MPEFRMHPVARGELVDVIAESVKTYTFELTKPLFPDHTTAHCQDCIAEAIAEAIVRYQTKTGRKIASAVATHLIEKEAP